MEDFVTSSHKDDQFWACGRALGGYPGAFPQGFLHRVDRDFGLFDKKALFPYGGAMPTQMEDGVGDQWVVNDIDPDLGHTTHDATDMPDEWDGAFERVVCDPPYGEKYAEELYDLEHPGYKNIFMEAAKKVEVGGYLLILDFLVYINWAEKAEVPGLRFQREEPIAVTTGPNMRIRVLNVFKRLAVPDEASEVDW